MDKQQIKEIASQVLREHGIGIITQLKAGGGRDGFDGANLMALMEIFASKLEAAKAPGIVDVIDGKMGIGWAQRLADGLRSKA